MKKLILVLGIFILSLTSVHAFWPFGSLSVSSEVQTLKDSTEKKFSDISAKMTGLENNAQGDMSAVKGDVSGIKSAVATLSAKVDGQASAVAGLNNTVSKVSSEIKSGRDTITSTNNSTELMERIITIQRDSLSEQIKIWKSIFHWILILVVGPLLSLNAWTVKALFGEMSNARYYQASLASQVEPDEFETIMAKKKENDERKNLINKAINIGKDILNKK